MIVRSMMIRTQGMHNNLKWTFQMIVRSMMIRTAGEGILPFLFVLDDCQINDDQNEPTGSVAISPVLDDCQINDDQNI